MFIDWYLAMTAAEEEKFRRIVAQLPLKEQEKAMEFRMSRERKGLEQGRQEGLHESREAIVLGLLQKRIGTVSHADGARLSRLTTAELDELAEALLDFTSSADLDQWLERPS